jgi:anti-sigma factor RsiW
MRCGDLDSLGVAYIDGETPAIERARIEEHLRLCPPCRQRIEAERVARDALHAARSGLREAAPASLRARCERVCQASKRAAAHAPRTTRIHWVPLTLAAAAMLVLAIAWIGRLDTGTGVLAAQVTLDHIKCTKLASARVNGSPSELADYWRKTSGWPIVVPAAASANDLRLSGIRRCASSEGSTAHIMYSYHGRPVSLFIARDDAPRTTRDFEMFGHETVVWSADRRTYLLVGEESPEQMQVLAAMIRQETLRKER